jgi:hypothetical protein
MIANFLTTPTKFHAVVGIDHYRLPIFYLINTIRAEIHTRETTYALFVVYDWIPVFSHFEPLLCSQL